MRPREDCTWPRDGCSGGERWPPYVEVGPPVSVSNALQGCQNTFPLPGTPYARVSHTVTTPRGWYGDFDIAEPAPNDYGTVK